MKFESFLSKSCISKKRDRKLLGLLSSNFFSLSMKPNKDKPTSLKMLVNLGGSLFVI